MFSPIGPVEFVQPTAFWIRPENKCTNSKRPEKTLPWRSGNTSETWLANQQTEISPCGLCFINAKASPVLLPLQSCKSGLRSAEPSHRSFHTASCPSMPPPCHVAPPLALHLAMPGALQLQKEWTKKDRDMNLKAEGDVFDFWEKYGKSRSSQVLHITIQGLVSR